MMSDPVISDLSTAFPPMSDEEFQDLVEDVRVNGLLEPITLNEAGEVIDGRHRLKACQIAGITPDFEQIDGARSEQLRFVVAKNFKRRHLNESQRAMVAAKMLGEGSQSLERYKQAAQDFAVSEKSVRNAKHVLENAPDNVISMVERGKTTVSRARDHVTGKVAKEELETKRGRRAKNDLPRIGSRKVLAVYRALEALMPVMSYPETVVDEWPGDPTRNDQLYKAALFMADLSNRVQEGADEAVGT